MQWEDGDVHEAGDVGVCLYYVGSQSTGGTSRVWVGRMGLGHVHLVMRQSYISTEKKSSIEWASGRLEREKET